MILTCPSCATRYFVKDEAVPSAGREVRCAACGTEWRAGATSQPVDVDFEEAEPASDGLAGAATSPLARAFRAKVFAQRQTRQAVAAGVVWAGLAAGFAVVAMTAVLFRGDVVRAFPRANAAYAAIRMPVNPTGLALEGVQGGPGLENGRQMLRVTGVLRNVETGARPTTALRVSLFDRAGHRAAAQVVTPAGGDIAPGEGRAFRAVFYDPPLSAAEFGVDFAWDVAPPRPAHAKAKPAPGAAHATPHLAPASPHEAPIAAPHGPIAEATSLPADSPYALHAAAH